MVDKKGNRVTSSPKGKGIIPFVVEITLSGNQQQQQVENEEIQGKEGEFSISFTPTTAGQHQISVSHKGRHFKGSPFRIVGVDKPNKPYSRDYNTVGTNPVLQFGSEGSGDGQLNQPYGGVTCNNSRVKSLLETPATSECKYLTGRQVLVQIRVKWKRKRAVFLSFWCDY